MFILKLGNLKLNKKTKYANNRHFGVGYWHKLLKIKLLEVVD